MPHAALSGDFSVVEKFLDDSERLYGEPHPSRCCVRSARRIVVKARAAAPSCACSRATAVLPCMHIYHVVEDLGDLNWYLLPHCSAALQVNRHCCCMHGRAVMLRAQSLQSG